MISKEEVKKIAGLARLELTEDEIIKMQKDMSAILDYFALLKKAPKTETVRAQSSHESALRKDEAEPQKREMVEKLIQSAPDKKDGYIKVKTIL